MSKQKKRSFPSPDPLTDPVVSATECTGIQPALPPEDMPKDPEP